MRSPAAQAAAPAALGRRDRRCVAEGEKELAEEARKILPLAGRERGNRLLLGGRVSLDRALDDGERLGRELDEDAPAIGRVRRPTDEACPLEPVDAVRDRRRRQEEGAREIRRRHSVWMSGSAEDAEHVVLVRVEIEIVEDALRRALDVPRGATDALDDCLGGDVQVGTLAPPLLEREVDVVLLAGNKPILIRR